MDRASRDLAMSAEARFTRDASRVPPSRPRVSDLQTHRKCETQFGGCPGCEYVGARVVNKDFVPNVGVRPGSRVVRCPLSEHCVSDPRDVWVTPSVNGS